MTRAWDYFRVEVQVGDLVLIQVPWKAKGLEKRYVARVTSRYGQTTVITVANELEIELYNLDAISRWSTYNTRSSFIILDKITGLPKVNTPNETRQGN